MGATTARHWEGDAAAVQAGSEDAATIGLPSHAFDLDLHRVARLEEKRTPGPRYLGDRAFASVVGA